MRGKTKIVHIALSWPMMDGLNYQDNLLPKFHAKLGFQVAVISSTWVFDSAGNVVYENRKKYSTEDFDVIRLDLKLGKNVNSKLKLYDGLYETLSELEPDILFVHEINFLDILTVKKYCKRHRVTLYVDNHCDLKNSCKNFFSKKILHGFIWRMCANCIEPYVEKFYGVLPARVSFLEEIYCLDKKKCELLVMGADDDLISIAKDKNSIKSIRDKYKIDSDDFLIVTGGKINSNRPETINLMRAIKHIKDSKVKLLIFGTVAPELKENFESLLEQNKIIYAGWQDAIGTYKCMASSNLVVFPGLHSVMWEQSVALGIPTVFKDIEGFHHVDIGGNCKFISDTSEDGIEKTIIALINDVDSYHKMKMIAEEKGEKIFSYYSIAKKSINYLEEI